MTTQMSNIGMKLSVRPASKVTMPAPAAGIKTCGAGRASRNSSSAKPIRPSWIIAPPFGVGLEWQVPGHEHCTTGIIDEQFKRFRSNANALAQFEYLFDMEDNDTSGGVQGWTGKIPNPPKTGTGVGIQGHAKAVAAAQ